ncbi:MAG: PAS domain S-box protein, partial [Candidatus Promineifilaceae bacterium]|nr:PAS domain S-box protein [Candidatus Promineifilaceae bacterium]
QSGKAQLARDLSYEVLAAGARDERHRELLRSLHPRSVIVAPLAARDRTLGVLVLAISQSPRRYAEEDLALAETVAARIALAVDNARLHRVVQEINEALESRVAERTRQLELQIVEHYNAERRFRSLLEAAPDGMIIVDEAGEILLVNAQAESIFGYPREELVGQPVEMLVPQMQQDAHRHRRSGYQHDPHARLMGSGIILEGQRRDGSTFPVEVSLSPVRDGQTKVVIAAVRDISARQQAQETLRRRERELAEAQRIGRLGSWRYDFATETISWSEEVYHIFGASPETFTPTFESVTAHYHPEDRERVLALLARAREEGKAYESQYRIIRDDGKIRVIHSRSVPVLDEAGEAVAIKGTWQDITALKEAELLTQTLLQLSERLNALLDVESVLVALTEEAMALVRAESGFAGVRTPEGLATTFYMTQGQTIPLDEVWPPGRGVTGHVLHTGQPYLTNDALNDSLALHEFVQHFGLRAILSTPIIDRDGAVIGFFEVDNKEQGAPFTEADQEKMLALAPIAAIAIQNALLYEPQRELSRQIVTAQEEERRRLSRDLHDSTGQILTAMSIQLNLLAGTALDNREELTRTLQDLARLVDEAHSEIRALSHDLRPPAIDVIGLDSTLEGLCADFSQRTGLEVSFTGAGVGRLPDQISITFYRFLQETLSNAARHANANHVHVRLRRTDGELAIEVADDGEGFVHNGFQAPHSGVGLLGLKERFELLDGRVHVASTLGRGTTITGACPLVR